MPFVTSERVQIYYEFIPAVQSKGVLDDIKSYDARFPLIIGISPWAMDVSYLKHLYTGDFDGFNRVLIDMRGHGRTETVEDLCVEVDYFVAAGDVANVVDRLKLPQAHFYGVQGHGGNVIMATHLLAPSMFLSISLMSGTDPTGLANVTGSSVKELAANLRLIADSADIYEILGSLTDVTLDLDETDILDVWIATFVRRYIKNAKISVFFLLLILLSRPRKITREILAEIQCPIVIFHGTSDRWFPLERMERVIDFYSGSCNVKLYPIKNGTHALYLYPQYQSEIAEHLIPFLNRHSSKLKKQKPVGFNYNYALQRIVFLTDDLSVTTRNAQCASSFSSLDEFERLNTLAGVQSVQSVNLELIPNLGSNLEKWDKGWEPVPKGSWTWSNRYNRKNSYQGTSFSSASADRLTAQEATKRHKTSTSISVECVESIVESEASNEI